MNLLSLTPAYLRGEMFTPPIPLSREALPAIDKERENLEEAVFYWINLAKHLPEKEAALFTQQIKILAEETLSFILTLSSNLTHSSTDIHREAAFSLEKLNASARTFYQNGQLHQRKKDEINQNLDRVHEKIQSASVNFDDFVIPSNNNQNLFQDVLNQVEKEHKIEQMITARSLVVAENILSTPINIAVQLGTEAVKKICGSHPTLERGCQKTSEGFTHLIGTISGHIPSGMKDTMTQMAENQEQNHALEAVYNEHVLGIPTGMTEQFLKDLPVAAWTPVTLAFGFTKAGKGLPTLLKMEKTLANPSTKEAKRQVWSNYVASLAHEKTCIERLALQYPSFNLPEGIPKNLNNFFSTCETHRFNVSGLGANKNGSLAGHLMYARTQENILFVIQKSSMHFGLYEKTGSRNILKAKNLNSEEQIASIIDTAIHFAKENRYQKVLLAWDSTVLSLASQLSKHPGANLKLRIGSFPGTDAKSLTLIEIEL